MLLSEVKEYFEINRRGTIQSISEDLCVSEDEVKEVIDFLEKKGKIKKMGNGSCSSCSSNCSTCGTNGYIPDVYEYLE